MKLKARFLVSRSAVVNQYKKMQALSDRVSYSYKTNREVGRMLRKTKCDFSVHSLASVKQLGGGERIWFFAQAWDADEIQKLFSLGVRKFVVDNEQDLLTLENCLNKSRSSIALLLRMRLKEHTVQSGKYFVYGMYSRQINALLPRLRKQEKITDLGIHFHRKTQNVSEWSLREELQQALRKDVLGLINIVNIGGGMPVLYKNFRSEVLGTIFHKIQDFKSWLNKQDISMIIEPGRFIAGPAVILEAHIVNIYRSNIVIDCSVYNAAMDTFVANIRLLVQGELERGHAYTIKGCTPDSMDIFRYKVYLDKPKIGDTIRFLHAGAYTYTTDFCNLPKLMTLIIDRFEEL